MALSFSEKRGLQKEVQSCLTSLGEKPDFKTKRSLQKQLAEALAKLGAGIAQKAASLLDRFLAGEFTKATPEAMWKTFCKVFAEAGGKLEELKGPLEQFFEYHDKQGNGQVLESAHNNKVFNFNSASNDEALRSLISLISSGAKGSITINLG